MKGVFSRVSLTLYSCYRKDTEQALRPAKPTVAESIHLRHGWHSDSLKFSDV